MSLSIAETAKKFGVTAHTLRYYEKEGLLPFVERTPSGIRTFSESDLEGLKIIMCLKNTGMQIKDIKYFIDLCMQGESTFEQRLEFLQKQKQQIEIQLNELKANLNTITYKEQYYKDKIKTRDYKN